MPVVLVVDDSAVDRRLVGGLLPQDLDWLVEFADNGAAALEKMRLSVPDLLITDMVMPEMDGMELVSRVRLEFPKTPVILITAHGSEMLAVEALRRGATSYVPKPVMAKKLRETVEQVLALSRADRSYWRLVRCLTSAQYDFALDNDPSLVPPLVDLIQQMLAGMEFCDASGRMHAGIALEEAMLNAILAGNLEMQPEEVQTARQHLRQGQHWGLVESRRQSSPFAQRTAWVRVNISPKQATFVIRDQGRGFDISEVPEKAHPEHLEHRNGRGLVLMKNFMDEVQFSPQGNEVTMTLNSDASGT
ncbi:MAG: response regulator [Planctomycetota bacterium]